MVIAGAGGHALEVLDVILETGYPKNEIFFYDDTTNEQRKILNEFPILNSIKELKEIFMVKPGFCLGVGSPELRKAFYTKFRQAGGVFTTLKARTAGISPYHNEIGYSDILSNCFIGPQVVIQKGTLINSRANIHHEVSIGSFCEISPGSILLGKVKIGDSCRIGSGAIILPNVILGDNVIVGAGAIVTRNFSSNLRVKGVPAQIY